MNFPAPNANLPIVKDGIMERFFRLWTRNVTSRQTLSGSGSPEGAVEAQANVLYGDTDTTPINIYFKVSDDVGGDKKLGWRLSN